ncbi:hypothetical protein LTR85_005788 [Meristemomyces frigidus]|nr:hypothetical protein LTR85_005788 [Meristemomyces frigidus]
MGFGRDHIREQIIGKLDPLLYIMVLHALNTTVSLDNATVAFRAFGKAWPIISTDGRVFTIVVGKRDADNYYAAVVYQTRGAATAMKVFVSGDYATSVEQAMVNLFDAVAEAVDIACGNNVEGHVALQGGGTLDMRK